MLTPKYGTLALTGTPAPCQLVELTGIEPVTS